MVIRLLVWFSTVNILSKSENIELYRKSLEGREGSQLSGI